jgi:tetratricopeptide (TPR) repeat protein
MRWLGLSVLLMVLSAATARAQIGKTVIVPAGSPEDSAVSAIYAEQDAAKKIALLDQFAADHSTGDFALLADQLYVSAYVSEKNYDKAFEYGEKALALDPDNFSTAVNLVRAAEEAADETKLFHYGELVGAILARFRTSPAPEGTAAADWDAKKKESLERAQQDIEYVESALYGAAYKAAGPGAKAELFDRYAAAFPDSSNTKAAESESVVNYQAAHNTPKMLAAAQKALKDDPNNVTVLVLLADYWSDQGKQLDEAEADAKKALAALPGMAKPDGVTDEQWQQQTSLQKGLALSAEGQVEVIRGNNTAAIQAFEQASTLLKSDHYSYGRNLYRWGFTLAKMRRILEARRILTQAVDTKSPYSSLAEQTLDKIGGPLRSPRQK